MSRVLIAGFCAVPGPRRAGVQMRQVIRALTPMHTVDLLVVREHDQAYVERQGSIRILRVPTPEAALAAQVQSFQRALKRQLEGADYDVVHCRDAWAGATVLEAQGRLGYHVVYDLSRAPLGEAPLEPELDAVYAREEAACLARADLVLAPTIAAAKAVVGKGKPDRVVLSPPGVDVDRFDWDDPPATGSPSRIVYVGSIDPGRGVRVLVRAMAAIVKEVDARLILAGPVVSPVFEATLRDGIRQLGLDDKVELAGPVDHDQIPALLASATVCVVPAAADLTPLPTVIFPTKLLEYMACKRAVVAPKRETILQVVENGRDVLLFEPGDPIDLARKVLRLLAEPVLRDRLAASAYDRVRREHTASAARRAIRNAYDRFGKLDTQPPDDEAPKMEIIADDDFEATVFEEPPAPVESGLTRLGGLEEALIGLQTTTAAGESSSGLGGSAPPSDDTIDRPAVAPASPGDASPGVASPPEPDDWVVSDLGDAVREISDDEDEGDDEDDDEGTPADGSRTSTPTPTGPIAAAEAVAFVAGEIDVPAQGAKTQEFTAASALLGGGAEPDPDTGKRDRT